MLALTPLKVGAFQPSTASHQIKLVANRGCIIGSLTSGKRSQLDVYDLWHGVLLGHCAHQESPCVLESRGF
jgi:hypothetical protein